MEVIVVGAIILFIFIYNGTIDKDKFLADNERYFQIFREEDYTFLVYAKYGEDADADKLYNQRVMYAIIAFLVVFVFLISGNSGGTSLFNSQILLNIVIY